MHEPRTGVWQDGSVTELSQARAHLEACSASSDVPHLAWGLFRNGELLAGAHTTGIYRIASMSKSFTAAAVLGLRAGLIPCLPGLPGLDLDAQLSTWLTSLRDPNLRSATVRDCLTMATGLPPDDAWADRLESMSTAEFDALTSTPSHPVFTAGTGYSYTNYSYALLGRLVETLTGGSFIEVVREHVLDPLGLHDTAYDEQHLDATRIVPGHRITGVGAAIEVPRTGPGAFSPIGGLYSTVEDIGRWVTTFLDAAKSRAGGWDRIKRDMQQPQRLAALAVEPETHEANADAYGYGLRHRLDTRLGSVVYHSGGYPGYGSHMRWHPDTGCAVIVMANRTYGPASDFAADALALLVGATRGSSALAASTGSTTTNVSPSGRSAPSPAAAALPERIDALIRRPSEWQLEALVSSNVALDQPWDERFAQWDEVCAAIGEDCDAPAAIDVVWLTSATAQWEVHGAHGARRVTITLTPFDRVQSIGVRAV